MQNQNKMFAIVYKFEVIEKMDSQFIEAWGNLTKLIYEFEGSLGSRLHKSKKGSYIAYAQWPSKSDWLKSGKHLPKKADEIRLKMRNACNKIKILHELECIEDILKNKPAKEN